MKTMIEDMMKKDTTTTTTDMIIDNEICNNAQSDEFLCWLVYSPWLHIMKTDDNMELYVYIDFCTNDLERNDLIRRSMLSQLCPDVFVSQYCFAFHISTWMRIVAGIVEKFGMDGYREPTEEELSYFCSWVSLYPSSYIFYLCEKSPSYLSYLYEKKCIPLLIGRKWYDSRVCNPMYGRNGDMYRNVKKRKLPWMFCNKRRYERTHPVLLRANMPIISDISYFVL